MIIPIQHDTRKRLFLCRLGILSINLFLFSFFTPLPCNSIRLVCIYFFSIILNCIQVMSFRHPAKEKKKNKKEKAYRTYIIL